MKFARLKVHGKDAGIHVSITQTMCERMRGLLGRDSLPPGEAILLRRCGSVHTFGMRFDIDVLFLDRHERVVAIHHGVRKRRLLLNLRAAHTLEMPAGAAGKHGLAVGDYFVFEATS
ncbi:hypothetical protein LMG28727_06415 [Paraburkholderia kirstenboschensis]|uniref:DUF192 domain-containing protein n=1 Tax=Paraburkholderia kirstenboschensis TaxID=1245436 RepID=UPI000A80A3AE|nr:DUF192 domain-containing protein [Paraburkholderia kirstenboschensis]CAD6557682.1 hypothetical protein LMG28727_06415 [Paraburkholderia kirstenboschensis]